MKEKVTLVQVYNAYKVLNPLLVFELPKATNQEERDRNFKANYRLSRLCDKMKADVKYVQDEGRKIWAKYEKTRKVPSGKEGVEDTDEKYIPEEDTGKFDEEITTLEAIESTVDYHPLTGEMASLYNLKAIDITRSGCFIEYSEEEKVA